MFLLLLKISLKFFIIIKFKNYKFSKKKIFF